MRFKHRYYSMEKNLFLLKFYIKVNLPSVRITVFVTPSCKIT